VTDPTIMVVEDDTVWRIQLEKMFSRILRGQSKQKQPDESFHPAVRAFPTATEAIEYLRTRPEDRSNSKPKVEIMSLDLNLGRHGGGTGLDVLRAAVQNGQKFATIAISGYAGDDDFREQLTNTEYRELQSLRVKVESITNCECIVFQKHTTEHFGDAAVQVRRIEEDLISRSSGNVLRQMQAKLRESIADLNGKCFCLHFRLPKALYEPCTGDWVAATVLTERSRLNKLGVWTGVFTPLDEDAVQTDILARLLFLTKPKSYFAGISLQDQVISPLPEVDWLSPQPRKPQLTPGEAFLLLQLIGQRWEVQTSRIRSNVAANTGNEAVTWDRPGASELQIVGLRQPTLLGWTGKGSVQNNGDSLIVERKVDGRENKPLKTNASRLHKKLRQMLGGVEYPVITSDEFTFHLATIGQVFVHRAKT